MIDKQVFERIFKQHYGAMYRLARKMLGDDAESQDVVSDVFAQLLHSQTDLRAETLQAYLLTLTRNRCINLLVHRQKAKATPTNIPEKSEYRCNTTSMPPARSTRELVLVMLRRADSDSMPIAEIAIM